MKRYTREPWVFDGRVYIYGRSVGSVNMKEQEHMVAQSAGMIENPDAIGMVRGWGHLRYLGEEEAAAIQQGNGELIALSPELLKATQAAKTLRDLAQRYHDGDPTVPWVIVRQSLAEWCERFDSVIERANEFESGE